MAQMRCEVEFQVADARTGRNVCATLCPRGTVRRRNALLAIVTIVEPPGADTRRWMQVIRRRGGLELASEDPPLHKALKMKAHAFEVYSSHVQLGKLTFIRCVCAWLLP